MVRTEPEGCDQLLDWYAELASITRSTAVILDVVETIGVEDPDVAKVAMELKTTINHLTTHWNFSNCEGDGDLLERRAFAAVRALEQPDRDAERFVDDLEDAIGAHSSFDM